MVASLRANLPRIERPMLTGFHHLLMVASLRVGTSAVARVAYRVSTIF